MAGWTETGKQTQYEAKPGQNLITITLEQLSASEQKPQWPASSFAREHSYTEGRNVAKYSYYEGNEQASYIVRASMSTEPIATHPMFTSGGAYAIEDDEWRKYKKWQLDPSSTTWRPDNAEASDAFKKYWTYVEKGIDSFLNGTVEMQVTEIMTRSPNVRKLGKIDAPVNAPTLPNSRTWMIVGLDAEKVGNEWRQVTTYRASMDGGWDKTIYGS